MKNRLYPIVFFIVALATFYSCEVTTFDSLPPVKQQLRSFPGSFHGEWEATGPTDQLYVNRLVFHKDTVFYEMESIAPGTLSPLLLQDDSLELHIQKKDCYLSIAGPGFWIHYVLRQPTKNELVVYGFGEETAKYVKVYEEDDSENGFMYKLFRPTSKEWKKLLKSPALEELQRFRRIE